MRKEDSVDSVLSQIEKHYDSLSKGQKKVADLILQHAVDATYLSAAQIAALIDVDRSTVIRTAQALGYDGFPDLQNALRIQLIRHTPMSDRLHSASQQLADELMRQAAEEGSSSVLATVVRSQFKQLGNLLQQNPDAQLETAVDMIDRGAIVYVLGLHYGVPLSSMMATLIGLVRPHCVLMDTHGPSLIRQLDELRAEDLLFVIAFHPMVRQTVRAIRHARSKGVPIILLTDSPISSAALHADLVLVSDYRLWSFGYSVAPFALMNALFAMLALRHDAEMQERMKQLGKLDGLLDVFEQEDD